MCLSVCRDCTAASGRAILYLPCIAELCSIWPRADLFMTMLTRVFASRSNRQITSSTKTGPSPGERFNKLTMKSQWSIYVPQVVNICTAQRSLYVQHIGHYMYRRVVTICTAQWSLYVPNSGHCMYRTVVTICTASGHYMYRQFNIHNSTFCPHSCIYVFCVDLRTNSDYFPIQH
jgi:hypothetical protein